MFLRSKTLGFVLSLVMLMSLSGCVFKRLIYDRLDWVVMYQIDSYLDLNKEQKLKIKPVLSDAIVWLKKDKIPAAIAVIGKLEESAKAHRYDDVLNKLLSDEVDRIRRDLVSKYKQPIVDLLVSLSNDQVDYLAKKLKKANEELKDVLKEKNAEEEYDSIIKKQKKTVEEWYGDLEASQEEFFYKNMRLTRSQIEERLAERERTQGYLLETLKSHDAGKIRIMVETFGDQGELWLDPVYLKYRHVAEERWSSYLKALHASLTKEQWTHLEGKLKELRADLEHMIGRD